MNTLREKQLLDVKEVAELLTVSERTVWAWTCTGDLPKPLRKGSRWVRWRRKDLEAWMESK